MQSPQGCPVIGHAIPPPHTPFSHTSLQHSLAAPHTSPSGLHCGAHTPLASQLPPQHSDGPPHVAPSGRHDTHAP